MCGRLLTRIVDVKLSKGRNFAVAAIGIHAFGGMSALGRIPRVMPELTGLRDTDALELLDVVGPLCTPLDWISKGLAASVVAGDLLTIPNVGAYAMTTSLLGFLSRELPAEIVLDDGVVVSASRLRLEREELH